MTALYVILGIVAAVFTLQVAVARWERRMVWPYTSIQDYPRIPETTNYSTIRISQARALGFQFLGWAADRKGPRYLLNYAFLVSPQRDSIVVIGTGKIISIPMQGTWIHTPSVNGRNSYYSTDAESAVEIDISGQWKNHLAKVSTFDQLWQNHNAWLRSNNVTP